MKVSAIQIEQRPGDPDVNMATAMAYLSRALEDGSSLIVLPELFKTGYLHRDRRDALSFAEFVTGETTAEIISHLRGKSAKVVFGMIESDTSTGLLYNSAVVVDEDGIVGCYRKSHLYVADSLWASSGGMAPFDFEVDGYRVRVVICADIEFPEVAYTRVTPPVDIICLPTAWVDEKAPSMNWWARAIESGASLICADLAGVEEGVQFSGGSSIISPNGSILATIDSGSGLISADLEVGTHPFRKIEQRLFLGSETFSRGELKVRALKPTPKSDDIEVELLIVDTQRDVESESWLKAVADSESFQDAQDLRSVGIVAAIGSDLEESVEAVITSLAASDVGLSSEPGGVLSNPNESGIGRGSRIIAVTEVESDGHRGVGIFQDNQWVKVACGEVRELRFEQSDIDDQIHRETLLLAVGVVDARNFNEFIETRVVALEGADLIFLVGKESELVPLTTRPSSNIDLPPYENWGPQTYNFSIVRQRAGENSTPIVALLRNDIGVSQFEGASQRQSGVFGGDYWTFPYQESIFGRESTSVNGALEYIRHRLRLEVEKGYMRRRHPELYGLL